mmetsp:Transcript_74645/g.188706  ORF Transcript_74645/g.188706 Transcript_74645/m.188706 type:complete len:84 (-) Transcript_74645:183-434(-)
MREGFEGQFGALPGHVHVSFVWQGFQEISWLRGQVVIALSVSAWNRFYSDLSSPSSPFQLLSVLTSVIIIVQATPHRRVVRCF